MLKHSICAVILVGLAASGASAIDLVWEPTNLILDEPTIVSVYLQANGADIAVGGGAAGLVTPSGIALASATPDGGLFFDLDGADNAPFTADDGWFWQNSLATSDYITQINPPEIFSNRGDGDAAFRVPANTRQLVATIELTGTSVGDFRLAPDFSFFNDTDFNSLVLKEGAEPVFSVAIPEPATMALLAIGGLGMLRRRRG